MQAHDVTAFTALFERVRTVFPLRVSPRELEQAIGAYFQAFARYPLSAVEAGADRWLASGERFPKPAQWISVMPRQVGVTGLTDLGPAEAAEHRDAIARGYQGDPCSCPACQRAEVTHRFLRYVPDVDRDGRDLRGLLDGKAVVRGHWAHGEELARWYAARDRFFALNERHPPRTMPTESPGRRWKIAGRALPCGFDPAHVIASGAVFLELITRTGRTHLRCAVCAEQRYAMTAPPPADLADVTREP